MNIARVVHYILYRLDSGEIDQFFNEVNFQKDLDRYYILELDCYVSRQFFDGVRDNPLYYKHLLFKDANNQQEPAATPVDATAQGV